MSTTIYKNFVIQVIQDTYPVDPRKEYDNLFKMVCFHSSYELGDKHNLSIEEVREHLNDVAIYKSLYLYDHSGLTISTSPFGCRWDSRQVGWIYVNRQTVRRELGWKRITKKRLQELEKYLEGEVETYDKYLQGDVWGYEIKDSQGNDMDSCWGFYGREYCLEEAKRMVDWYDRERVKKHTNYLKRLIKSSVPLQYRRAL